MSEKKKKVFISGPMSGIKDYNKPAFDQAEQWLTQAGYSVFNPARMHFDDAWDHSEIMRIDLAALAQCDYIYMLPKWYYSKGALQEYHYANAIGVKMLDGNDILKSKCEMLTKPRIQIESFGDISGRNLYFLQWFEKYCNKVLAKGETLPGSVDTAIEDLTDYMRNELGIKSCGTCAFETDSRLAPCLNCGPFKNWKPKTTSEAPKKTCDTCKYYACSLGEEPCKPCKDKSNWEPKDAEK